MMPIHISLNVVTTTRILAKRRASNTLIINEKDHLNQRLKKNRMVCNHCTPYSFHGNATGIHMCHNIINHIMSYIKIIYKVCIP